VTDRDCVACKAVFCWCCVSLLLKESCQLLFKSIIMWWTIK